MQGHIHKRASVDRSGRPKSLYYVVIDVPRGPDGKRRQKWHGSFPTRKAAEIYRADLVTRIHRGTFIEPSALPLETWVRDRWLPSMRARVKPSTWHSYSRNCETHLLPRLGHYGLRDLTPSVLNTVYGDLLESGRLNCGGGGLSPKTVRYLATILHKALADAVDEGLLAVNPATKARPPKPSRSAPTELRFWTPDELRQFLASVAGTRLEAAWHLAAMTGMRRGEVLGLRWRDLDLDAAKLAVRHTLITVDNKIVESDPKNHTARVIDLDVATADQLRRHRLRQQADRDEWGSDYQDNDLVFCREDGSPLHPDGFSQSFQKALDEAGLPRIRLHDLRHSHASIALAAGVPVKVVSERLGHGSPGFTLSQYVHVMPGAQAEAAARVAALVLGTDLAEAS